MSDDEARQPKTPRQKTAISQTADTKETATESSATGAEGATDAPDTSQSNFTWLVPVALAGVLVALYAVWPEYRDFVERAYTLLANERRDEFERWIRDFGAWGPLVLVLMMLMQTLIAFIPSVLIMIVAVLAYGPVAGGALAWGGLLLAGILGYSIGRSLGPVTVYKLIGRDTEQTIEGFVGRYGFWAIIAARISPALSTDAVSYVAGLVKMKFWEFVLATGAGTLPLTVLIAYLGADFERLESGLAWVSGISILVFIGYVLYRRRREKRREA